MYLGQLTQWLFSSTFVKGINCSPYAGILQYQPKENLKLIYEIKNEIERFF